MTNYLGPAQPPDRIKSLGFWSSTRHRHNRTTPFYNFQLDLVLTYINLHIKPKNFFIFSKSHCIFKIKLFSVHDLPQIWNFSIIHVPIAVLPPKNTHAAIWEGHYPDSAAANVTALRRYLHFYVALAFLPSADQTDALGLLPGGSVIFAAYKSGSGLSRVT